MTTYKASATMERKTDLSKTKMFYPMVKFWSKEISDSYIINQPQESRNEALKIARKAIKNLKTQN